MVEQFNLSSDDIKDLSIAALIAKMIGLAKTDLLRHELQGLLGMAKSKGISGTVVGDVLTVESGGSSDS
jgi:hypothetical protein